MPVVQPWPRRLLRRNVAPWLVTIARTRPVRLWLVGNAQDLVQISRSMADHGSEATVTDLQVQAFATPPLHPVAAQLVRECRERSRQGMVKVDLFPRTPERPVDLVSLRQTVAKGISYSEVSEAVRPGGRLLSEEPVPESTRLWPLDESGRLFYKPDPRANQSGRDRADYENSLVSSHIGLAKALARRFEGRGEPREELQQVALTALTACARRYDPTRCVPFGGYAAQSVLGELKRHFRDCTWGAHVARPVQERYLALKSAREILTQSYGRAPKVIEVAAYLHATEDEVIEAMEAGSSYWPLSLDRPCLRTGEGIDVECSEDSMEHSVDLQNLAAAIRKLSPLGRLVVRRYFFEERTQQAIAAELGVSQMQVSRIIKRAVGQLRAGFADR